MNMESLERRNLLDGALPAAASLLAETGDEPFVAYQPARQRYFVRGTDADDTITFATAADVEPTTIIVTRNDEVATFQLRPGEHIVVRAGGGNDSVSVAGDVAGGGVSVGNGRPVPASFVIQGGDGDDTLIGGDRGDRIAAGEAGNDSIRGCGGQDSGRQRRQRPHQRRSAPATTSPAATRGTGSTATARRTSSPVAAATTSSMAAAATTSSAATGATTR